MREFYACLMTLLYRLLTKNEVLDDKVYSSIFFTLYSVTIESLTTVVSDRVLFSRKVLKMYCSTAL